MNMSENINEVCTALTKAQAAMLPAVKNCTNKFLGNTYADLSSVWDAVRPVLACNGLCVLQFIETVNDKNMLVTMLAHSSGQWIKSYLPIVPKNNDSQGIGAALTYMRRYGISALIGVVCDEDDDGETAMGRGKTEDKKPAAPKPAAPKAQTQEAPVTPPPTVASPEKLMTPAHIVDLTNKRQELSSAFNTRMNNYLKDNYGTFSFKDLPDSLYGYIDGSITREKNLIASEVKS